MEWLDTLDPHWVWLALGLLLAASEIAVPGLFLIWLAAAAIITGLLSWIAPIGWPVQIVIFAVLSIVSVFAGRRYIRSNPVQGADPLLNQRGAQLVGHTAIVTQAIEGGSGRVRIGDSEWLAQGPDILPGTRVRVTGAEGVVLVVEPVG